MPANLSPILIIVVCTLYSLSGSSGSPAKELWRVVSCNTALADRMGNYSEEGFREGRFEKNREDLRATGFQEKSTAEGKAIATGWSKEELEKANTAVDAAYMTEPEKEVVKLINLARLDGKKFLENNFQDFIKINNSYYISIDVKSTYMQSLKSTLLQTKDLPMLYPEPKLEKMARFHAEDMGNTGETGHSSSKGERFESRAVRFTGNNYVGENCSYGFSEPIGIVGQLLLDDDVPSLGHRKNILDKSYSTIGVGIASHKVWKSNCVIDFSGIVEGN